MLPPILHPVIPATIRPIPDLLKGSGSELSPDLGFLALLIIMALHLLSKYTIYRGFGFPLRVRKIYLMHLLLDEVFLCRRRPFRNPVILFSLILMRPTHALNLLEFQHPQMSLACLSPCVFLQSLSVFVAITYRRLKRHLFTIPQNLLCSTPLL